MKKIMVIFMLALTVLAFHVNTAHAQSYDNTGVIDVTFVNQDPDPVEPGNYVDVRWKVENLGTEPIENVQVELMPSYPFSLEPGDSALKEIRTLDSLQQGDTGFIIKYKVRVDENALEGTNTIKLRYKTADSSWTTQEYDIDVQTRDANIAIDSVETTPSTVLPGKTFNLKIKLKNMADSVMKDVSIKLDLMLSSITAGTATTTTKSQILDALPFAPINSATEKKVRNIKPGDEMIFSYSLIAYPDAEAKVYKVPIQLSFFDSQGNEYTQDDVIGIVVNSEPDVSVVLDDNQLDGEGSKGSISIKFVNKGMDSIKFLNVKLKDSDDYKIISSDEVYIGNIDSDDYDSADFNLLLTSNKTDIALPIHYEYMDAQNDKIQKDAELDMRFVDGANEKGNSTVVTVIVIAVLLVVVLFIIFAVRKRRRKN